MMLCLGRSGTSASPTTAVGDRLAVTRVEGHDDSLAGRSVPGGVRIGEVRRSTDLMSTLSNWRAQSTGVATLRREQCSVMDAMAWVGWGKGG